MQRPRVSFPVQLCQRPSDFRIDIIRLNCQGAIENDNLISISSQIEVAERNLLQGEEVARIQLYRALQIPQPLFVVTAPTSDITGQLEHARIVG